jgi:hypothetical protein
MYLGSYTCTTTKKTFVVSVGNPFMVSVRGTDTIRVTQQMRCLWCPLVWTGTKNSIYGIGYLSGPIQKINF